VYDAAAVQSKQPADETCEAAAGARASVTERAAIVDSHTVSAQVPASMAASFGAAEAIAVEGNLMV